MYDPESEGSRSRGSSPRSSPESVLSRQIAALQQRGAAFKKESFKKESLWDKPVVQYGIGILGIIVCAIGLYLSIVTPVQKTDESKDDFDARVKLYGIIGPALVAIGVAHIAGSIYLIKFRNSDE